MTSTMMLQHCALKKPSQSHLTVQKTITVQEQRRTKEAGPVKPHPRIQHPQGKLSRRAAAKSA